MVLCGGAAHMRQRRLPTNDFADGVGDELGIFLQLFTLVREAVEPISVTRHRIAGRVISTHDEQNEVTHIFKLAHVLHRRMDHAADKVGRFAAIFAFFPQILEIGAHFKHFGKSRLTRLFGTEQLDVARPIGPFGQLAAVFPWEIEQQRQHLCGQFDGYQVDPVKGFANRKRVQKLTRAATDIARHAVHFTRCEGRCDDTAFFGVLGPVHCNEHGHDDSLVFGDWLCERIVVD